MTTGCTYTIALNHDHVRIERRSAETGQLFDTYRGELTATIGELFVTGPMAATIPASVLARAYNTIASSR